jgi:hydroxymethylpyrimidine/phosphomethylpyrimidine kinase
MVYFFMHTALTIAGSDPTGGAGLQADLKVFRAFDVYGYSVPSALTAQNTTGVDRIYAISDDFFHKQLTFLLEDVRPGAIKTGMLYTTYVVELVAEKVKKYRLENLVVDPVAVSSSGMSLIEDGALDAIKTLLFPLAAVITPNIYEAAVFTGINLQGPQDVELAAGALKDMGPGTVVVTGGHFDGRTVDTYYDGSDFRSIEGERVEGEYHGTGCAFSAAVTAMLSLGHSPIEAVQKANEFVRSAIRNAYNPGRGMGLLGL